MELVDTVNAITEQFDLGEIVGFSPLSGGIVNTSFKVESTRGNFVFQKLNHIFNALVIEDYKAVQSYLRTNGLYVPVLLADKTGKSYYQNKESVWRVTEYIPSDQDVLISNSLAFQAGKVLGKFHSVMSKSSFRPKFKLEGFHDTRNIIKHLDDLVLKNKSLKADKIMPDYLYIKNEIPALFLDENLPKTLIHGDPKLNNFLFKKGEIISILDLDTVMEANVLLDIGDALRSWCRFLDSEYNSEIFFSFMEGYRGSNKIPYTNKQAKNAMSLLTLELCARFLNDYFEENYFSFDKDKFDSLAAQNLDRERRYLQYYRNFRDLS